MTDKIIRGAGGPPPTPPPPYKAPDTLNSRQFATILDLISEGEIEGFATPSKASLSKGSTAYNNAALKDIFLNDTPILNSSASNTNPQTTDFNFQNVGFTPRFGTSNQTHIAGIEGSQSISAVGVTVTKSNAVTRQITNTAVDAAKVTITFPQLQKATDEGDLLGSSVNLKIQVQYDGGGFTEVINDTITGRTADAYQKEYRVTLTGSFPVDIRVVRVTADSTSSQLVDAFTWTSLTEIVDDKQTYPNSAYTSLRIDSEQFNSIPKRAFRVRGVKVRIPGAGASGSGTPSIDLQTGRVVYPSGYIFNGTMGAAQWCSCPALILLDLLTTERYGFGAHIIDSNLDLFSFIAASKYANELVDDGFGGQEARFSCNVNIQGSTEAFDLINELAGVMRSFPIWSEGSVTLTQDRPTDSSYLFSLSNVGEGGFSYSGSSLKQRHTVISVSYFNMDSREIDYEIVEDTAAQNKLGIIKKDVKGFACTSRGQAQRLGKAILFSEQQETEVVSFTTSIDAGAIVRPGSVISVNDPVRGGERRSGRIKSATTTAITVDNTKDLDTFTGTNKKCSVILPNGSVETKNILSVTSGVISLDSALSATPNVNSIWLVQSSTLEAQTFRVISVEEKDGINFAITALTYINGKYANIEQGISLPARNISLLNEPKNPPSNLKAEERIVIINKLAIPKLILSWVSVTGVSQYLVQYRFNSTNWVSEIVFRPDFEILNTEAGAYEFKVFSYNAALKLSATSSDITFNAVGKNAPPSNVQNLQLEPVDSKNVRLKWDQAIDPDVLHGGRVYVRHSSLTDGTGTFNNAVDLVTALSGNSTEQIVPALEGEYILRFQDDQGNFSTGSASVIVDLPDILDTQIILSTASRQDLLSPAYGGQKIRSTVIANTLRIEESTGITTGIYDFKDLIDLEQVYSLDLKRFIRSVGFEVQQPFKTTAAAGIKANNTNFTQSIQGVQVPAKTIRVTSNGAHNLALGDPVQLVGQNNAPVTGIYVISAVGSTTQFDLAITAANNLTINTFTTQGTYRKLTLLDQLIPEGSFWDDYATDGNFDGISADSVDCQMFAASVDVDPASSAIAFTNGTSFTYVQDDGSEDGSTNGTVMTCTATGHGLSVGDNIKIIFIQDNFSTFYTVQTVPNANKFTLTSFINQDVSSGSGNFLKFTKFTNLTNGTFKGRGFAFQLRLTTEKPLVENIEVQQAGITALFPSRTENSYLTGNPNNPVSMAAQQSSASGQKTVTFANRFFTGTSTLGGSNSFKPNVGVTVQDLNSGEYVNILNVTGTSFDIVIRDSSNSAVARTFTFTAVGYGKGV